MRPQARHRLLDVRERRLWHGPDLADAQGGQQDPLGGRRQSLYVRVGGLPRPCREGHRKAGARAFIAHASRHLRPLTCMD